MSSGLPKSHARHLWAVAVAVIFAASMWFYVLGILVPYQVADAARTGQPRGNLSDLYPRWLGARELLLHGRAPYRDDLTREIQIGYYGRELDLSRPSDPHDPQAFAYPAYIVFLLAPTIHLDFSLVQAAFNWLLIALIVISVPLWLRALNVRFSRTGLFIATTLTLGCYPVVQGVKLQQLTLLVSAILAAAAAALSAGMLIVAGVLLAIATIKPQLVLPLVVFLAVWTLSDIRHRWRLAAGFTATMLLLVGGAEIILPGWVGEFYRATLAYRQYTRGTSFLTEELGPFTGQTLTVLVVLLMLFVFWRARRQSPGSTAFSLALCFALGGSVLLTTWHPYNQVLFVPVVMLLLNCWRGVFRASRATRLFYFAVGGLVVWPWVASTGLTFASLILPHETVQHAWTLPLYTTLSIPLGMMALLGLQARSALRGTASG